MRNFEVIHYQLFGLHLQEPLALIYNWAIAILCIILFFRLKPENSAARNWKSFFLIFAITCFFGGMAHTFFYYFGIKGKIPHWIGGLLFSYFAGCGMVHFLNNSKIKDNLFLFLKMKFIFFAIMAISWLSFSFVTMDSAITYLAFCGGIGIYLIRNGIQEGKYYIYGTIFVLIAGLCFLAKIDLSLYFNREDLSHVFILFSVLFFYFGTKKIEKLKL